MTNEKYQQKLQWMIDWQGGRCFYCRTELTEIYQGPIHSSYKAPADLKGKEKSAWYRQRMTHVANIDHIVPKHLGGLNVWYNRVASCMPCNFAKADLHPKRWEVQLRMKGIERGRWTEWKGPRPVEVLALAG